jgi:hypothetical protein
VIDSYVQALSVTREAEAYETSQYAVELEGALVLDDLREGRVGLPLAGNAARLDVVEPPVHASRRGYPKGADVLRAKLGRLRELRQLGVA